MATGGISRHWKVVRFYHQFDFLEFLEVQFYCTPLLCRDFKILWNFDFELEVTFLFVFEMSSRNRMCTQCTICVHNVTHWYVGSHEYDTSVTMCTHSKPRHDSKIEFLRFLDFFKKSIFDTFLNLTLTSLITILTWGR